MRVHKQVTAVSWIPSEAVSGAMKMPFEFGVSHYDEPPPDELVGDGALDQLQREDRFRFANRLAAWVDFDDDTGRPTAFGYDTANSKGLIGSTFVFKGRAMSYNFQAFAMPDIQQEPQTTSDGGIRFAQTAGGRTGAPAPRRVRRAPFVQWRAPLAWTTLSLTIRPTSTDFEVAGASRFPRHWIYGPDGKLAMKSGMTDFKDWYRRAFGKHSPWGDVDSPALVTAAETALERQLSSQLMRAGEKPRIRKFDLGDVLAREGEPGTELLLVLDGVVRAEKDGERLAEYGPGALLGERAIIEGGLRTATLVAVTPMRVAVATADTIDRDALVELSGGHRHEERNPNDGPLDEGA